MFRGARGNPKPSRPGLARRRDHGFNQQVRHFDVRRHHRRAIGASVRRDAQGDPAGASDRLIAAPRQNCLGPVSARGILHLGCQPLVGMRRELSVRQSLQSRQSFGS